MNLASHGEGAEGTQVVTGKVGSNLVAQLVAQEGGEKFLALNEFARWEIIWSISTHVNFENKPTENWVTSGILVSSGKDEASKTSVSRVVDLMIEDGKVKKGYIHQRQLSENEKP